METIGQPVPPCVERSHHEGDVHLIREIMRAHQALLGVFSATVGMPASRLALVRLLAVSGPSGMPVSSAARALGVDMAAITRQVQLLQKQGMVLRRNDDKDLRRCYVRVSANVMKRFGEAHERSHELERSLLEAIGVERAKVAIQVLAEVRQFVDAQGVCVETEANQ